MRSASKKIFIELRFALTILVVFSIMGTGCVYTNWAVKILNYQESYTQREFVRERSGYIVREKLPDYVEVTLITSSNLRKEVEEMMQGFTYEDRLKLAKSSKPIPSWATLSSEKAQSLIKLLQDNSDKLVFKVTLFGSENWVLTSDLEFVFYDGNKSCKPVQIEVIKKCVENQYLYYITGYERSGDAFSSVVFVFFDDRIENRQEAKFTITGKYEEIDLKKLDDLLRSRRAINHKRDIHYETIFINYIFPMEKFR